jgi:copper(I)-binding protein
MNGRLTTCVLVAVAALGCSTRDTPPLRAPDATLGNLQVFDLGAPAPAAPDVGALYFTLVNTGAEADTLTAVATPDGTAMLHTVVTEDGLSRMRHVMAIPAPPRDTLRLRPGGYHVMVSNLARRWAVGDTVRLTLTFARAGRLELAAPVRTYTEVVERLERSEGR